MKLVKFKDGTFGVMKRDNWFYREEFLGVSSSEWWAMPQHVQKYCKFKTKEDAESALLKMDINYTVIK